MTKSSEPSDKTDKRRQSGLQGEAAAAEYILAKNYVILHRNWRCRSGELDIIAQDSSAIIIIEVRTRTSGGRFGTAAESVDSRKQRQVRATAEVYLQANRLQSLPVRFDVIAVTINRGTEQVESISHIEAAF
ncbi:UPF0102 protein [Paenibacillus baekrokdamisoli]|uniref:UPF0102 protein Back11_22360 n=1 Tax=Paenibacillus baekrokdamisoli TaxID=1712516 RepID=A0A3G9J577_9BACL|nr:YraN family protein [Paenibacillus baekrokdamisoli]MBB3069755.1 putative endonuclease [Paenibacillus baekrokdamisoli]BBH20891.1 UPF0102 protein [Paenibacillus baekrokdamisoli]